ncbi:acyl-CoA N-acyltransferase [Schizophyllum amplum]|uniref:N-alpha-acetyltransferase 60 n=1 Tax=Schizophyllum amplum TaxID=97359 RepID=A0A550CZV8_9AGAR|nr:acyl-CoA N-acyltransferase [Auriculariopsis ampla]
MNALSQYVVRPLVSSDIPAVRDLHTALLPARYPSSFYLQLLLQRDRLCLVACPRHAPSTIVAFVSALKHDDDILPTWELTTRRRGHDRQRRPVEAHVEILTIGVLREHQHHGLAQHLVHTVATELLPRSKVVVGADLHASPSSVLIQAHVSAINEDARRFYERLGMRTRERITDAYRVSTISGSRDAYLVAGRVNCAA